MNINFCPQCGNKAKDDYNFCPNCGLKFPRDEATVSGAGLDNERSPQSGYRTPVKCFSEDVSVPNKASCSPSSNVAQVKALTSCSPKASGSSKRMGGISTRSSRTTLKRKSNSTPEKEQVKETVSSPGKPEFKSEMSPRSKKAKNVQVQPLPENDILTDHNNTGWVLTKLLSQEKTPLYYKVHAKCQSKSDKDESILKLDAKDGKIYNEQNFFQRAAKKTTVDKWKNVHGCPGLGIPTCIGFGVHTCYRFLVFPALGQNLQTVINELHGQLPEIAVYQILYRMIDVLEYVHENEYVHGDITANNIYINADYHEVYLAGYYNAFRYRPDGNHVNYKDGSRTPNEGTAEFISLDVHNGAGPFRRSDLESLGYCILKWLCGSLPWTDQTNPGSIMEEKKRFKADVPGVLKKCFNRRKIPDVLKLFLEKVMNLNYDEKPDYHEIQNSFSSVLQKFNVKPYDPIQL
ncbi:inactive serine/threonine-protein kinase VRK3 isoform X1 [Bufo bufo]|uniref:inactive serine/threonine-protein kinase VRK3 isoform X1 n=1 Tax=Bufo bufo TaxID=8384 RepID=UPI001ABE3B09|nr:inactive serine/threonine-protein kinase VRK3 isoform X1 [Bufo bufo]